MSSKTPTYGGGLPHNGKVKLTCSSHRVRVTSLLAMLALLGAGLVLTLFPLSSVRLLDVTLISLWSGDSSTSPSTSPTALSCPLIQPLRPLEVYEDLVRELDITFNTTKYKEWAYQNLQGSIQVP